MNNKYDFLEKKLIDREKNASLRQLKVINNKIDFSSNDYLGLSQNPDVKKLIEKEIKRTNSKNGSGGSRLLAGNSQYCMETEKYLAKIHQTEASLIFNSGYSANLSFFSSVPQKGDTVLYDELIHSCIKDGMRLGLANFYPFKHNDLEQLEQKITKQEGRVFIALESIYSMDGDCCPLEQIVAIAKKHNALIVIDEAHSSGNLGKNGSGFSTALNLDSEIFARIHTFGKGIGAHGACIVGSQILIDYLINFARPFIYTTSLPDHSLAVIKASYQFLEQNEDIQKSLLEKIKIFKSHIQSNVINSDSAIQGVIIPTNEAVKNIAHRLQEAGFDVRPVMSPTVKKGSERLRVCLHIFNTNEEIISLCKHINSLVTKD